MLRNFMRFSSRFIVTDSRFTDTHVHVYLKLVNHGFFFLFWKRQHISLTIAGFAIQQFL